MEHHMEILAPAGDVQGVIAAINGGADAVYFGGKHFNARQRADNFDEQEMVEMVDLCHRHGLKVYITLNILVKDSEWPRMLEYLAFLDALSPDGIIVQDPGLMLILREYYPDLPLQTSTQGSVYGTEGTLFFQELGFKRVVLPREITLPEVRRIRQNVSVELKVFCHGALCYAYSGQCLFSSLVGGRSGNRGLCAQPCRKPYTLWDDGNHRIKQGYLMSMKDLNTRAHLLELAEAGVNSLKIEGRMKSPEYIYAASRAYQDAASGRGDTIDGQTLAQVFNRGFTTGWIMENSENLNPEMGKNRGTPVGVVKKVRGRTAIITLLPEETLHLGDGLAFGEDGRIGQKITRMETGGGTARLPIPRGVVDGMPVFRTLDARLMAGLREKALAKLSEEKIPLRLSLTLADEKPIQVEVLARGEIHHLEIDILPSLAQSRPLDKEIMTEQLSKLGDTEYFLAELTLQMAPDLFLPKSSLNALRRSIIEEIDATKPVEVPLTEGPVLEMRKILPEIKSVKREPRLSLSLTQLSQLEAVLNLGVDEIVLPYEAFETAEAMAKAICRVDACGKAARLALPKVMHDRVTDKIKSQLDLLKGLPLEGVLVRNYEALHLLRDSGLSLEADSSLHIFNRMGAEALYCWGCRSGVISPELDGRAVEAIARGTRLDCTLTVYGRQEMMISANCLLDCGHKHCDECTEGRLFYLEDSRGMRFPLRRDALGMTHIYNGDKLFLKKELMNAPHLATWRIEVLDEGIAELESVVASYRSGFGDDAPNPGDYYTGRYTKGNFKRGVE